VKGYLAIHGTDDESGLFVVNYLNQLMRSRLQYTGTPVVFSDKHRDKFTTTLEAIFPNMGILKTVIENLSPFMVRYY